MVESTQAELDPTRHFESHIMGEWCPIMQVLPVPRQPRALIVATYVQGSPYVGGVLLGDVESRNLPSGQWQPLGPSLTLREISRSIRTAVGETICRSAGGPPDIAGFFDALCDGVTETGRRLQCLRDIFQAVEAYGEKHGMDYEPGPTLPAEYVQS